MWRARLDAEGLAAQLDVLVRKQRDGKHPHALLGGELPFGALGDRGLMFARELAATIARREYRFEAVVPRRALFDGKWRVLYRASAIDMIVSATLAAELTQVLEPTFPDQLYSYRRGRSSWQAVRAFVAFVEEHRRQRPDVRQRGLYVVRRDVRSYGDNIPVTDESALWRQIERAVAPDSDTMTLLHEAIAPTLGGTDSRVTSVPTGSSLQPMMCNLYLTPVDSIALMVADGFYARAGDDMLFAHHDANVARDVAAMIDRAIAELRLDLNATKSINMYFTGAGRPSGEWPEGRGTTHLDYLGARVDFHGGVGLKNERARLLLRNLRRRIDNTLRLARTGDASQRARACCAVVRGALEPTNPQCEPTVPLILGAVNDRAQLKQLDYWIALHVAQGVTGRRGVRAFRALSYHSLRRDHGLPSLVVARHRRRAS